jgi:2-amino-4-hydroxy-6-hydroxymethyldihydropteridine diphosphokinase
VHLVAISIGSNLGASLTIVRTAVSYLHRLPAISVNKCSRWYITKAIVAEDSPPQPDYINGCAILTTTLDPETLLTTLLATEQKFGRERRQLWSARTLDLDILLFDDLIVHSECLTVPHPRMHDRAFVLLPLQEIAPDWVHPLKQLSISELAKHPLDADRSQPRLLNRYVGSLNFGTISYHHNLPPV